MFHNFQIIVWTALTLGIDTVVWIFIVILILQGSNNETVQKYYLKKENSLL